MSLLRTVQRFLRELSAMRDGGRELLDEIDRQRARDERWARASIQRYPSGTVPAAPVNPPRSRDAGDEIELGEFRTKRQRDNDFGTA